MDEVPTLFLWGEMFCYRGCSSTTTGMTRFAILTPGLAALLVLPRWTALGGGVGCWYDMLPLVGRSEMPLHTRRLLAGSESYVDGSPKCTSKPDAALVV